MFLTMNSPFIYDRYVTGKDFIGRRDDCTVLGNLISQGENVALYDTPRSGKTSLVQQTLFNLRIAGKQFFIGQFSLHNIRSEEEFLLRYGTTAIRTVASSPGEYADIISRHLDGTHFVFDQRNYSENDKIISLNWKIDDRDMDRMLRLPYAIAKEKGQMMLMIMDEFQNIALTGEGDKLCKALERAITEMSSGTDHGCCFLMSGCMVNAMKEIFEEKRLFYRLAHKFTLSPVSEKDIIEHIVKGFLVGGKIVERELLLGMCRLFRGHLGYINHFIAICDSMSKGYIVESTLMDALDALLAINKPRFLTIMNNLTTFQVNMLRAILEGVTRFSSSEVISKYSLNSSANVKRLKDALAKKEIVIFGPGENVVLEDPLFEYWARKYFFEMKQEV